MSFSRESRYRNITAPTPYSYHQPRSGRRIPPGYFIVGAVVLIALLCCCCVGLVLVFQFGPGGSVLSSLTGPTPTPAVDKSAQVPLKAKALADNGLELTVTTVQRPLQVQNLQVPPDQQYISVSVHIQNTKKSGAPINVSPADFKMKGDGGLQYDANPPKVTMDTLMQPQESVAPGKTLDRDLIFQIAANDSGLKLYWTVGKTTRVFLLEAQK